MEENLLTDSYVSIRRNPKNLIGVDEVLFRHELQKEIAPVKKVTISNIYITGNGYVIAKEKTILPDFFSKQATIVFLQAFKFYFHLFKRIIRNRFVLVKTPVIFITDRFSGNYFHWITEALPRLLAGGSGIKSSPVILPSYYHQFSFIEESLKIAGFTVRYLNEKKSYVVRNLLFVTHFATGGNYNDYFIQKTRETLNKDIAFTVPSRLVYISRGKAERRKIANEDELLPVLLELQFETVYCEDLSLQEQRNLFSQTKVLVSNHGAGLTNMIFMPAATSVLELRYQNDRHNNCYYALASALDIDYYYQQCLPVNTTEDPYAADLVVDKEILRALLSQVCNSK
jgi:capsular polysaccharide biosynthesis protein